MLKLLNASVAITADVHNPSVLHPSFLKSAGIVPSDWEASEPPVCTAALSLVKFTNGFVFTVDSAKLQIVDNDPPTDAGSSELPAVAARYIRSLPHVSYSAVGRNMTGFVEAGDANEVLLGFLREDFRRDAASLTSVGLRFVYSAMGMTIRLALDSGTVTQHKTAEAQHGIVVAANYHSAVASGTSAERVDKIVAELDRFRECWEHFRTELFNQLRLEGEHARR